MEKRIYMSPEIKVNKIDNEELLAGSLNSLHGAADGPAKGKEATEWNEDGDDF